MNLNLIGAILTTILGVGGLLKPLMVAKLVGLTPSAPHGISEVRATLGGFFIGLGGFAGTGSAAWDYLAEIFAWQGIQPFQGQIATIYRTRGFQSFFL